MNCFFLTVKYENFRLSGTLITALFIFVLYVIQNLFLYNITVLCNIFLLKTLYQLFISFQLKIRYLY